MGKDAPEAPDPTVTARKQYEYTKKAAEDQLRLNALDQSGPFGSATFDRDESGLPTGVDTSLSGVLQGGAENISDAYQGVTSRLPTDNFDSTTAAPDTSYISDTFYNRGRDLLKPDFDQAQRNQEIRMSERGIPIGSEVWNTENGNLDRQQSLALSDLANRATLQAPGEQQRLIGNARQDYLQPGDQLSQYGSNLGLLKGLTPGASQPSASLQAPNYSGLAQQAYESELNQHNSDKSGIGQLVSTGIGVLGAPFTGGTSLGLAGGSLGGLFGGGGGGY